MKNPDPRQAAALLRVENFDSGPETDLPGSPDPVTGGILQLHLDQLQEFDRNPRRAANAEYDMLKASLIKTGAEKVLLTVTRRPGEDCYFPAAGGNTRLRILKELWEELRDEKYCWVNCKFIPYQDEAAIMVAHLAENDNRAEYIFIDRARAIIDLYEGLKEKSGGDLSQRDFIARLLDLGYPKLSRGQFVRYSYTVQIYEHIPQALDAGMGLRAVDELGKLQKRLQAFFTGACRSDPDIIDRLETLFPVVLSERDSPEGIDHDSVSQKIFVLMAPSVERYAPDISSGELATKMAQMWSKYCQHPDFAVSLSEMAVRPAEKYRPERPGPLTIHDFPDAGIEAGDSEIDHRDELDPAFDPGAAGTAPHDIRLPMPVPDLPEKGAEEADVDHLFTRHRNSMALALDRARRFAGHFGIDRLVQTFARPEEVGGYGFWMDIPVSTDRLDEAAETAWWWLFDLSGIAEALLIDAAILDGDPNFRASRFSALYRQARAPEGLPEEDSQGIFLQAMDQAEERVARKRDYARLLWEIPDRQYVPLVELVEAVRGISEIKRLRGG